MAAYNATMNTDIPVIYTAVSDPVEAGLANEDGTPVGNITGTSDALAVDAQLKMIREVLPGSEDHRYHLHHQRSKLHQYHRRVQGSGRQLRIRDRGQRCYRNV